MRSARPMGLSQDGRSLIVATSTGEELAIPVDDRLHAALRGDQPRLGQLEIEMEDALTPRDIQSRIRSGQTLDEVGRVAGMPLDRVERFAAPVLAEREHVALLAMSASVRRRGETSGHRLLRLAVSERLVKRGVDIDGVEWDACRRDDGRWSVSASYSSGESSRQAVFVFDPQGRFSVADNDEARWVLGEQSPAKGPQPGRRRVATGEGEADTEPTLDLSDELALVRVIQPPQTDEEADLGGAGTIGDDEAAGEPSDEPYDTSRLGAGAGAPVDDVAGATPASAPDRAADRAPRTLRSLHSVPDRPVEEEPHEQQQPEERAQGEDGAGGRDPEAEDEQQEESPLETLSAMLASQDAAASGGLSDASAVPETDNRGWEPAIVVDYPVEPSPETRETEGVESAGDEPEGAEAARSGPAGAEQQGEPGDAEPESRERPSGAVRAEDVTSPPQPTAPTGRPQPAAAPEDGELEGNGAAAQEPAARPAAKRKRAAVPSWDEIMFGGPPRSR